MDIMIIVKWCTDWLSMTDKAPSIITTLIDMVLKIGAPPPDTPLWGNGDEQKSL